MSAVLSTDMKLKQLCRATGEPGFHNYTTLQGHLLSAIIELNLFNMPCWSLSTLNLTPFNTFAWPCDCVKPLLTILVRNNCHYLLSVSEDLMETLHVNPTIVPNDAPCTPEDLFQIDGVLQAFGWSIWSWGLGELYGANTMLPPLGVVIHDKKRRQSFVKRVQLMTGDQIQMFFKSTGLEDRPEYIPAEADQVIEYFILKKWYETRNPNLADNMERKYKEQLYQLRRFEDDNSEDGWIRSMSDGTFSSPKFT